jgi:DNA polymerase-3 subunit epsilon
VRLDQAHAANADALAAARVAFRLATRMAELGGMDLAILHREQVCWAAEQAASLEDYFREQGRAQHVERVWPVVPAGLPRAA